MFLFSALFLGIVVTAFGLDLAFKVLFKVTLPTKKALGAFVLIYIGIVFMSGDVRLGPDPPGNVIIFKEQIVNAMNPNLDYSVYFAKGTIDFSSMPIERGNIFIECNTLFAKETIVLRSDSSARIIINPSMGLVRYPDGRMTVPFFKNIYATKSYDDNAKAITIKTNLAFGILEIIER